MSDAEEINDDKHLLSVSETDNANDSSLDKPEIQELISEEQEELESIPKWCAIVFELILIWMAILMLWWDVATPIGYLKTLNFKDSQLTDYSDLNSTDMADGCWSFDSTYTTINSIKWARAQTEDIRIYTDTPVWFNQKFRQSFGQYWTALITIHVMMAWIVFPTYLTQIIRSSISRWFKGNMYGTNGTKTCCCCCNGYSCCVNGDGFHRIVGGTLLGLITILWTAGGVAGAVLIQERGFHPCANTMLYNDCKLSKPSTASSFSFFLYLQFVYDGALISSTLLHGVAARIFRDGNKNPMLRRRHILILNFISVSCVFLYFLRTSLMGWIIYTWYSRKNEHFNKYPEANVDVVCNEHDTHETNPNRYNPLTNPVFLCIGMNGCAKDVVHMDGVQPIFVVIIMFIIYLLELLVIPWINIGNIFFTREVYNRHFKKSHKHYGKLIGRYDAGYNHGANLTACSFAVLWTFMANVGFSAGDATHNPIVGVSITFGSYILLVNGLLIAWYLPIWRGKKPHSEFDIYFQCGKKLGCTCCENKIDKDFEKVKQYEQ